MSLITGFDIGAEQKTKRSSQTNFWYAPVVIAKYSAFNKVAIAARAEYYSDKKGVIISTATPNGFQTLGFSVNIDYVIQHNIVWRIETRTLNSKGKIFEKKEWRIYVQ